MSDRRYTWTPDLPDPRDLKFVGPMQELPSAVDLRPLCPPVVNQGQVGSCTANALAAALGFLEINEQAAGLAGQPEELAASFEPFSRMFIYYNERDLEGDVGQDGGAQIRDGVKSLAALGCCAEATWPYKDVDAIFSRSDTFVKPSDAAYAEASAHKISSYLSIDNTDAAQIKACLAAGFPVVFGFTVFPSFESDAVASNGVVPMPGPDEEPQGGHAVLCVGYDDARGVWIVRNSWGDQWGQAGYCLFPYAYLTDDDLATDFWTLRR